MKEVQLPSVETDLRVGEIIEIEGRIIYPVVRVSVIRALDGKIIGGWAAPLAMLVIEANDQYAISFTGDDVSVDQIAKIAPELKKIIDKSRRIYRIEVF